MPRERVGTDEIRREQLDALVQRALVHFADRRSRKLRLGDYVVDFIFEETQTRIQISRRNYKKCQQTHNDEQEPDATSWSGSYHPAKR